MVDGSPVASQTVPVTVINTPPFGSISASGSPSSMPPTKGTGIFRISASDTSGKPIVDLQYVSISLSGSCTETSQNSLVGTGVLDVSVQATATPGNCVLSASAPGQYQTISASATIVVATSFITLDSPVDGGSYILRQPTDDVVISGSLSGATSGVAVSGEFELRCKNVIIVLRMPNGVSRPGHAIGLNPMALLLALKRSVPQQAA